MLNWSEKAKWLVVAVLKADIVEIDGGGKVKFPRGRVVFVGDGAEAATLISKYAPTGTAIIRGTATAGYGGTATAGYGGTISIRYYDDKREKYRMAIAEVGEDGILPNTAYVVDGGKLVKKTA